MQAAAERAVALQQSGHGAVTDVPESRLLREAGASAAPLVAHLALEGWQWSDELDEHMAMLAARHLGTRFVRTPITPASTLHLRLRSPPGPGTLLGCAALLLLLLQLPSTQPSPTRPHICRAPQACCASARACSWAPPASTASAPPSAC